MSSSSYLLVVLVSLGRFKCKIIALFTTCQSLYWLFRTGSCSPSYKFFGFMLCCDLSRKGLSRMLLINKPLLIWLWFLIFLGLGDKCPYFNQIADLLRFGGSHLHWLMEHKFVVSFCITWFLKCLLGCEFFPRVIALRSHYVTSYWFYLDWQIIAGSLQISMLACMIFLAGGLMCCSWKVLFYIWSWTTDVLWMPFMNISFNLVSTNAPEPVFPSHFDFIAVMWDQIVWISFSAAASILGVHPSI